MANLIQGVNDLATTHPELAKEWHPTKNGDLKPTDVVAGCNKKVWWYLPYDTKDGKHFDFEWEASIVNRTRGTGCPYLVGKAIWIGFNDLATTHPELSKEWHPTKNGNLKPTDVMSGSNKKVWWYLPYDAEDGRHFDFEWEAIVANRVKGVGCPYLVGQAIWVGFNDLATTHPELAKEWHPTKNGDLKPTDVIASGLIWWKCKNGHEWKTSIHSRYKMNGTTGCPICSNKRVLNGVNDLATTHPELAKEWHPTKNGNLKPTDVVAGSNKKVWWYLPYDTEDGKHFDFEWKEMVTKRAYNNRKCPYLANLCKSVYVGFNDLATTHPELAKEWHPTKNGNLKPTDVTAGSSLRVWWYLPYDTEDGKHFDFEWSNRITDRVFGDLGCPYLHNKIWIGFNDLAITNPELAKEWHPTKNGNLKPTNVMAGSNKRVWWKCKNGHEWQSDISNRNSGIGCPICSGKQVMQGFNDVATTHPDLAKEWNYEKNGDLKPTDVSAGSGKKTWWKCKNGHEWKTSIYNRCKMNGTGCPVCNESHLEKSTRNVLSKYGYNFTEQVKFNSLRGLGGNLLSFDFAISNSDGSLILVECQGEQHYRPVDYFGGKRRYKTQLEHDRLKQEFCKQNHILLIQIPYCYDEEDIDAIFRLE